VRCHGEPSCDLVVRYVDPREYAVAVAENPDGACTGQTELTMGVSEPSGNLGYDLT
jgi:hypothetical protein